MYNKKGRACAVDRESRKVIGYVLFKPWETSVYEIGWIFNKLFWRQGYAFEACSNLISYAFETLNACKVVAEAIDTQKSVGLMEKLVMKLVEVQKNAAKDYCGGLADMYIYEIIQCGGNRK